MSLAAWSWALCAVQVTAIWLQGRHLLAGWGFGIAAQLCVWIPYSIATGQPGTTVGSSIFCCVLAWNIRKWRASVVTADGKSGGGMWTAIVPKPVAALAGAVYRLAEARLAAAVERTAPAVAVGGVFVGMPQQRRPVAGVVAGVKARRDGVRGA